MHELLVAGTDNVKATLCNFVFLVFIVFVIFVVFLVLFVIFLVFFVFFILFVFIVGPLCASEARVQLPLFRQS